VRIAFYAWGARSNAGGAVSGPASLADENSMVHELSGPPSASGMPEPVNLLGLASLFDQLTMLVSVHEGPAHVCVYRNPAFDSALGRSGFLGRPLRESLPQLEAQGQLQHFDEVYRTGEWSGGLRLVAAGDMATECQGRPIIYKQCLQPWRASDGSIRGVISFAYQVDEPLEPSSHAPDDIGRDDTRHDETAGSSSLPESPHRGPDASLPVHHADLLESRGGPLHALRRGESLIHEGRPLCHCYILKEGWLAEYKTTLEGGRQILNFRLPGDVVAIEALTFGSIPYSVVAVSAAVVAPVPTAQLLGPQRGLPQLLAQMMGRVLREKAILHEWELSVGRRTAHQRMAHLLLELHERLRRAGLAADDSYELLATQQDLADALGLTNVHVSRILHRMRDEGVIEMSGRRITIRARLQLVATAGFDPRYLDDPRRDLLEGMT
jgi:CRP-like cAMP-binding protein